MSYQRIAKPRIYVDMINPLLENGTITGTDQITGTGLLTTASKIIQLFDNKPNNTVTIVGNGTETAQNIIVDTNIANTFEDATCHVTSGSAIVTHDANANIVEGLMVYGAGLSDGLTIDSITNSTTFVLEDNADAGDGSEITLQFHDDSKDSLLGETLFVAILGHNLKSADAKFRVETDHSSNFGSAQTPTMTSVYNSTVSSNYSVPTTDGWSLITYQQQHDARYQKLVIEDVSTYDTDVKIGCILWGIKYTFPSSPDLNIKRSFSYDGLKINESLGGQKYAHATYLSGNSWTSTAAWDTTTTPSLKTGRQKIDMSFSYLSDTDVFPSDLHDVTISTTGESVLNRLIWMTNGGMHPLLLQLSHSDTNDDDGWLYCRLGNKPSFTQVAHRNWSTQLSFIEEF